MEGFTGHTGGEKKPHNREKNSIPRRKLLAGLAAAAGIGALAGKGIMARFEREHEGDLRPDDVISFLEGEEIPALAERGFTFEKAAAAVEAMLAEDHQSAEQKKAPTPWDEPLLSEAVRQVLKDFSIMVRVEERFGDALERAAEEVAEEIARHSGINMVKTFGPAEVNPHTAKRHALEHAALLLERKLYSEEELAQLKKTESAVEIARLLRLSGEGAVLWGGYIFSRGMDIYGRNKWGKFQLENKRTLSLTYACYSANEYTPAVSALQNVVNDLGILSGSLESPIEVDGDLGNATKSATQDTLGRLRRQGYRTVALQREVERFLALHDRGDNPVLLARAAWRVMHQAGALQRRLFESRFARAGVKEGGATLGHLVAHRYSASLEAYMRLYDVLEENVSPNRASGAFSALKEIFRAYVFDDDTHFIELLAREESFTSFFNEKIALEDGEPAPPVRALYRQWQALLLERLPRRWESDGRCLGTVPTAREVGLFSNNPRTLYILADRNIFGRVLLAYEMLGGKYSLNLTKEEL